MTEIRIVTIHTHTHTHTHTCTHALKQTSNVLQSPQQTGPHNFQAPAHVRLPKKEPPPDPHKLLDQGKIFHGAVSDWKQKTGTVFSRRLLLQHPAQNFFPPIQTTPAPSSPPPRTDHAGTDQFNQSASVTVPGRVRAKCKFNASTTGSMDACTLSAEQWFKINYRKSSSAVDYAFHGKE